MTVNKELLVATLHHIEENPEEWEQSTWRCSSGMCFAGTAAVLAGGRWTNTTANDGVDDGDNLLWSSPDEPGAAEQDGHWIIEVDRRACNILGLPYADTVLEPLFDPTNKLPDLRRIVGELVAE